MRVNKIGHILLIGILIWGSAVPVNAWSGRGAEDCVICGHACCCPEMCEQKVKELKRKSTPARSCDQPDSLCELTRHEPLIIVSLLEKTWVNTQPVMPIALRLRSGNDSFLLSKRSQFHGVPFFDEIPTPPPRSPIAFPV